ncbi:hypothetical protein THIOKS1250008 [Thiocapsa sp. KS1]|nr:hypothetical protein THIOKS1250008 [Thiocapsa sp. KS1]
MLIVSVAWGSTASVAWATLLLCGITRRDAELRNSLSKRILAVGITGCIDATRRVHRHSGRWVDPEVIALRIRLRFVPVSREGQPEGHHPEQQRRGGHVPVEQEHADETAGHTDDPPDTRPHRFQRTPHALDPVHPRPPIRS